MIAMSALNNQEFFGAKLEISLSKPPSDKNKKEEMLRNREKRMIQTMTERFVQRFSVESTDLRNRSLNIWYIHSGNLYNIITYN